MALRFLGLLAVVLSERAAGKDVTASATQEALRALDTDGSGKVERREIEAFAKAQGLSDAEVRAEFREIDLDGDGELSESEIRSTLDQPEVAAVAPNAAATVPAAATLPAAATVPAVANVPAVATVGSSPMLAQPAAGSLQASTQPLLALSGASLAERSGSEQIEAVYVRAQANAGKALAEIFAHSASSVLASRTQDVQKATKLEEAVKSLRGQGAELERTSAQVTAKAAKDATAAVLQQTIDSVHSLEAAADQAAQQAAVRRTRAQAALQAALKAQADMRASVKEMSDMA